MWGTLLGYLIAALKAVAVVAIVAIILAVSSLISPGLLIVLAGLVAFLSLAAAIRPFAFVGRIADKLWLFTRTAIAVSLVASAAVGFAIYLMIEQHNAEIAARQHQAEIQALRINNPKEYLAQLKAANDPRWENEFQTLDKVGYDAYLAQLKAEQEQIASGFHSAME